MYIKIEVGYSERLIKQLVYGKSNARADTLNGDAFSLLLSRSGPSYSTEQLLASLAKQQLRGIDAAHATRKRD